MTAKMGNQVWQPIYRGRKELHFQATKEVLADPRKKIKIGSPKMRQWQD